MCDLENYMNVPVDQGLFTATAENIIKEYLKCHDVGKVAKIFCIRRVEVNAVLRKAGIDVKKGK